MARRGWGTQVRGRDLVQGDALGAGPISLYQP